jgi:heme-degrading monooxygenase HmoA
MLSRVALRHALPQSCSPYYQGAMNSEGLGASFSTYLLTFAAFLQMDEILREVKEHVLPLLQQRDGFKGFITLEDRQSGKLIGITFWESEQAMQASEEVGDRTRSETAEATHDTIEDVVRYEVGLFEMSG